MTKNGEFRFRDEFHLEQGGVLHGFRLFYSTLGRLNEDHSNVIWVCHALTGNSDVLSWWGGLFGSGKLYDPDKYFIICANVLGGCYGSTGPLDVDLTTGNRYYHTFPSLTARDVVASFDLLRQHLGIHKIHTLIGGSQGGQHALEWAASNAEIAENLVVMAANARHSPWGIAFSETQRMAIRQDPTWVEKRQDAGINGMKTARAIAMMSYRCIDIYNSTQTESNNEKIGNYQASSYQAYQGEKLANRFNAFTYMILIDMLDSHNIGRGRGGIKAALSAIKTKTLIIGVRSDLLFPVEEQVFCASYIPDARLEIIESIYGHDGFLVEVESMEDSISRFYKNI